MGALFDREAVGVELREPEIAPIGRRIDVHLALGGKRRERGDRLARELGREDVAARGGLDHPASHQRLDRLGPHAGVARQAHVAVLDLLAQRHVELQAEAAHEVLLVVGVVDDGVDHPDRSLAGVEIEAHDERQQGAPGLRQDVRALDLDRGPHRPALLERHLVDPADVFVGGDRAGILTERLVIDQQHQPAVLGDHGVAGPDRLEDDGGVVLQDPAAHGAGVDVDHLAVRVPRDPLAVGALARLAAVGPRRGGRSGRPRAELKRAGQRRGGADGLPGPFERAVGPVRQRPGLQAHLLAVRPGQHQGIAQVQNALGPGHAPAHAAADCGRRASEPVEGDRGGGIGRLGASGEESGQGHESKHGGGDDFHGVGFWTGDGGGRNSPGPADHRLGLVKIRS